MKLSYDPEVDAVYIRLVEGKHECRTVRLSEEVALNIGADEKLIGIEVLDAKRTIGAGQVPSVALGGLTFSGERLEVRESTGKPYRRPPRKRID
jgi:uncharacterized protein YuzE